jgi:peptide/nickel transport system permease protein
VLGVTLLGFILIHLAPGDPIRFFAGDATTLPAAEIERLRGLYGLDEPLPLQYLAWLGHLIQLDLGTSFISHQRVALLIAERLPATLLLGLTALAIGVVVGVGAGLAPALRPGGILDSATRILAVLGNAVPTFWSGLVFILLFAVDWRLFPSGGIATIGRTGLDPLDRLWHLIPPALVLSLHTIAEISRFVRTQALEAVAQDYVRTARGKGLSERAVTTGHVLRNTLIPVVTVVGGSLPTIFGGAIVVESVFSWPGMGRLAVEAAFALDYPLLMGILLILAVLVVIGNLLSDVAYGAVDPRIRLA